MSEFASKSAAEAYNPGIAPDFLRLAGYAAACDGGAALYRRVVGEPTHAGKFQIAEGSWYEIAERVLRPEMFGATLVAECASALQAMFLAPADEFYFPSGAWRADSDLDIERPNGKVALRGPGVLDFSHGNGHLHISGSVTQIGDLAANVPFGGRALTFGANAYTEYGLEPGSIAVLYNPDDYSWGSRRANYHDGAMFRIHSTEGVVANVFGQAVDPYVASDFDIYRMDSVQVEIDGLGAIETTTEGKAAITISFGADCTIRKLRGRSGTYALLEMDRCFNSDIDASPVVNNSPVVGDEYGIVVSNCHHTKVRGSAAFATRHSVALGGNNVVCAVPNRDTIIEGMTLFNWSTAAGAGDAHGNCDLTKYINCVMLSGLNGCGRNFEVSGCTIYDQPFSASGTTINAAENVGGRVKLHNTTVHSTGTGAGTGDDRGFCHFWVAGIGVEDSVVGMREDMDLIIDGLTLVTPNAGSTAVAVRVAAVEANKKINIHVVGEGIIWKAPAGHAFIRASENDGGALASDCIIVDQVYGPAGARLLLAEASNANVPLRMMLQTVASDLSLLTSDSTPATPSLNFRYRFPRVPEVVGVSHRSTTGAAKTLYGGKVVTSQPYQVLADSARLQVLTADGANFSAADTARVAGTFAIRHV